MNTTSTQPDALLGWMTGLADATRLRLLRLLERHELGVADLCDVLQMPQSTVSRHLKVLADQGWVTSRRSGTTNLYRTILDELDPAARELWVVAREQTEQWASTQQDQVRLQRRLKERNQQTREFFAGMAGDWQQRRAELYGDRFDLDAVIALLPRDWTVADLGCGSGAMALRLAKYVKKVYGVDDSKDMLHAAERLTQDQKNIELTRGELDHMPLPSDVCDAATLLLVLTYLANPVAVLEETHRILTSERGGGRVVVVDLLRHDRDDFRREMGQAHMGFGQKQLASMLTDAGFTHVKVESLPPEPQAKGPALLIATGEKI